MALETMSPASDRRVGPAEANGPVASRSERRMGEARDLKKRDNITNFYYLAKVYAIIAGTIAATLWSFHYIALNGLSWWWAVPIMFVEVIIIGASQHQLGGVIHEGTHFILFENRKLNELVSDWLGGFPIYTSTYQYRVHHLAHHQFVNDPERDPDISQLKDSNHWLDFPVTHIDVLVSLLKQLWLPNLFKFTLVRARYSSVGHDHNPYIDNKDRGSKWPVRVGILFALGAPALMNVLCRTSEAWVAQDALLAFYAAVVLYFLLTPEAKFAQTRLLPTISHKATAIGRVTFMMLVYGALTLHDAGTGKSWAWDMYGLLWVVPLFTTFPLFMMIRQWVQHGNADRGRYTNTRVFLVGPLVKYAVFPWGMDYHLPHHLMASVPHYRLKDLHEQLLKDPKYAELGVVVEGVVGHHHHDHDHHHYRPSIIDVIGHGHAPVARTGGREAAYVDSATLEYADVKDRAAIAQEERDSAKSG